jgi:polysaccharide deacetylase family protein (PEP-CTERM system associated)
MQNILSVDVEDWFHILDVAGGPSMDAWDRLESRVERNLSLLLDTFDAHHVKVTCFFLGWVAERLPHLVLDASRRGHEIASHGYAHQLVYRQTVAAFREDIGRAKAILEDITGERVAGYRAPGFSITRETPWAMEQLAAAGHTYDSSIFPSEHGHGGLPGARMDPHRIVTPEGPLVEFPISVARLFGRRICFFGGGYLRLFPYRVIKRAGESVRREGRPIVYYIHPREVDPRHPRLRMGVVRRFKSYVNLSTTSGKLEGILRTEQVTSFRDWTDANAASFPALAGGSG